VNLNQFFTRTMTDEYNCLDLARDVWRELTGEDIADRLPKLQGRFSDRRITLGGARTFQRLQTPVSPCICLMQRPGDQLHVGIYYNRRVIQLTDTGVTNFPHAVATRHHPKVRWYK